ncbi:DJ-1/PfpI family protein, partial [Paracoccaceae bacterium]|nr:DJ-1/PfpI family protein [Paracoccaceae bacterium]
MSKKIKTYTFLLTENFSHMPFSCAIEAFRIANLAAEKELYRWQLACEGGDHANSSNGTSTKVDIGLDDRLTDSDIIVVAGLDAKRHATPAIKRWLRWHDTHTRGKIGAICCGAYVLAEAGLLGGK